MDSPQLHRSLRTRGLGEQGLYYYYDTFAKTMAVLKLDEFEDAQRDKHDWRKELAEQLFTLQQSNGSWVNPKVRWLEGDPNLSTAYALARAQILRADAGHASLSAAGEQGTPFSMFVTSNEPTGLPRRTAARLSSTLRLGSTELAEVRPEGSSPKSGINPAARRRQRAAAFSAATKPHALCVPSQNGRFLDCPQRQRAIVSLFPNSKTFPSWSTSVTGPVTKSGPFSRVRIETSAMFSDFLEDSGAD